MQQIRDAILAGDTAPEDFANIDIPDHYRGVTVHKDEQEMFAGVATKDKDPRKSLHVDEVALPELGPGEALIAVMASAINFNTVWTSIFEPVSTFGFLDRYGRISPLTKRHDLPYHVVGSDAAGVVLRVGPGVNMWKPGDEVVAHCLSVELEHPSGHSDTMMDPEQRIWGFETNFGGLAEIALVKSNQLMPKPKHLTWEEAASPGLVNSTAYRQLVSQNGGAMKHLGCLRWPRWIRHSICSQWRSNPCVRSLVRRQSRSMPRHGCRTRYQSQCRGLQILERRAHAGPQRMAALRQEDSRTHRRRRH